MARNQTALSLAYRRRLDKCFRFILLSVSFSILYLQIATADSIEVSGSELSTPLLVPMNRAIVLESKTPFVELSIANPNIADISTLTDQSIYILGKSPGRTTLTILGADGKLIRNVTIQVSPDVSELKERLYQILPGEVIEVRTANDGVVLSGTVSTSGVMDRAVDLAERYAPGKVSNLMSIGGTHQVMLKVKFAEMSRSVSKQLAASLAFRSGLSRTTSSSGETGSWLRDGNDLGGGRIVTGLDTTGALGIGYTAGSFELGILLEAMEAKGYVRTLAEPNLAALSGQEASFLAGGEYPVPVASSEGQITIQYKPFGVELRFTPTVLAGGRIQLELQAAVSGIDNSKVYERSGISVSSFRRRETSTTVEMRNGESFAIAGLLQDEFRDVKGQVPWLGDIPILGTLFRSTQYEKRQSELIIVITAHLVSPVHGDLIALPTDRILPPQEHELFLRGKIKSGPVGEVARQDIIGSYGYVLD